MALETLAFWIKQYSLAMCVARTLRSLKVSHFSVVYNITFAMHEFVVHEIYVCTIG